MAKDPAFLFYPNDWIGGTMGMTFEEKGAYMELLMMQFNRGHMTKDMIAQTLGHKYGQLWGQIEDKFSIDAEKRYFNLRLEEEKLKRKKYVDSRNNNRSGNNQHTKKKKKEKGHVTYHMENEDEDVNKDSSEGVLEKFEKPFVQYPFDSGEFKKQWSLWKDFKKKEFKFKYKSLQSEQAALTQLSSLANGNEKTAIAIIHQSFANGWKGFFNLKNQSKEPTINRQTEETIRRNAEPIPTDFIEKIRKNNE